MVTIEAVAMSGKILAVDAKNHKVTIQEPDGNKKTLTVSKMVKNLDQLKPGDSVDIGITEDLAVEVVRLSAKVRGAGAPQNLRRPAE